MIEIMNITNDPFQRHTIITPDGSIEIKLRYYPRAQFWTLSTKYKDVSCKGLKLSLGTLHLRSRNMPFDFIVIADTNSGIDPFTREDFATGRCRLLMLEKSDMESIRAQPVPL